MIKDSQEHSKLRELKNYLIFLQDYGYSEIPVEMNLEKSEEVMKKPKNSVLPAKQTLSEVRSELGDCTRCKFHGALERKNRLKYWESQIAKN